MCGINGFTFPDQSKINRMNGELRHRGPDDCGTYVDEFISLGSTRLAILDPSVQGHMPMASHNGRYLTVFNGEIYNFKDLREHLFKKNYHFKSGTDTEVVVNLFAEYGPKAFAKLNGMFAIAIWDKQSKNLTLARDRVGIKPLYYSVRNNQLIFSSEIKALLLHQISKRIDPVSLDLYLRLLYVPAPRTIYKDIYKLEPGHYIQWHQGKLVKKSYASIQAHPINKSKSETISLIRETVKSAVADQLLLSDRPVGVFLSGGIDSNIVLGCATQISPQPVKTFSVSFTDVPELAKFNADAMLAQQSAEFFGANHHQIELNPHEALDYFREILVSMDEPIANPTHIPTYALAKGSVKNVTVALGGDGGDELFGGYDRYLLAWQLDSYQYLPKIIRYNLLDRLILKLKKNPNQYFLSNLRAENFAEKYLAVMGQDEGELQIIHPSDRRKVITEIEKLTGFNTETQFHKQLPVLDLVHWLAEESLMRSDKMTMLHSLEQRVPLLDNRVIELAMSIPFNWKVGIKQRKMILREAFANELPEFIRTAPKRGFFSPAAKWVRHQAWQPLVKDLLTGDNNLRDEIYKSEALKQMYEKHLTGEKYNMQHLWAALTLLGWMKAQKVTL